MNRFPTPSLPRSCASGTARRSTCLAGRVRRRIHGRDYVMYGFNGQYPGPLIHVDQDSTIFVNFENQTSWPTAIHWHGVRLDNAYDGVPNLTQDPVPPGGRFEYRILLSGCRPLLVPPPPPRGSAAGPRSLRKHAGGGAARRVVRASAPGGDPDARRSPDRRRRRALPLGGRARHPCADGPLRQPVAGERRARLRTGSRPRAKSSASSSRTFRTPAPSTCPSASRAPIGSRWSAPTSRSSSGRPGWTR